MMIAAAHNARDVAESKKYYQRIRGTGQVFRGKNWNERPDLSLVSYVIDRI